jgi:hypothetical protein
MGLLLDIGALALLRAMPDQFLKASDAAWSDPERRDQIENEVIGCTQADVTVALFRHWRLPGAMTEAVRRRRESIVDLSQSTSAAHRALIEGAAIATWIGDYFCTGDTGNALIRCLELGDTLFRMSVTDVRQLLSDVHARVQAGAALFNTDLSRLATPEGLMEQAKSQLSALLGKLNDGGSEPVAEAVDAPKQRAARAVASLAN